MCKELKRLILLADCVHLNKTDRDSIQWAIQNLSPEQAETETSFGGWDFQAWPSVPDKRVFEDLTKARKAKNKVIMLQAYIDNAAPHLNELSNAGVTVNEALKIAGNPWRSANLATVCAEANAASRLSITFSPEIRTSGPPPPTSISPTFTPLAPSMVEVDSEITYR